MTHCSTWTAFFVARRANVRLPKPEVTRLHGRTRRIAQIVAIWSLFLPWPPAPAAAKPNIVVILTDDQGYADVSYNPHHPKEVRTPHIDGLAAASVLCTQGYTSGHVCSPTRAGLMTGRYQQRFGIYTAGEGGSGVPLSEVFLPQYLKKAGYVSGAFGKWHLGVHIKYNAIHRGFDEFYGFMGRGAHDYFNLNVPDHPIYRGTKPIKDEGCLTHRITAEAVSFIKRHKSKPFLAYVAYNAVHAPAQAPPEDIHNVTGDKTRDTLMAMLKHLDAGVGQIVATLKSEGLFDNTLLFCLTDNGGSKAMHANNAPLRGYKQQDYEGGVRVPFLVSWPSQLNGGTKCDVPVSSIDILPTALAAAGVAVPKQRVLDGKDMLPALQGKVNQLHEHLFWSSAGYKGAWAVRSGRWKLVAVKDKVELFDLQDDVGESKDLAGKHPEQVARLTKLYHAWLDQMAEPASGQPKRWSRDLPNDPKKKRRQKRKQDREKRRLEQKKAAPNVPAAQTQRRSNVLLIVCDDLNTHVSTSGYPHIQTPSLDRLSAAGMRFSRAYCQYPVCGPSRASFLSGLYPESTRVLDNKTDIRDTRPETISLPQLFKDSGYWTGGVGKVFHGKFDQGERAWNEYHKFDNEWNPVIRPVQRKFEAKYGSIDLEKNRRAWRAQLKKIRSKSAGQTPPGYGPTDMTDAQHKDGKNVRQVLDWLSRKAYGKRPFFITCGIQKPHVPFWAPKKYFDMYPLDKLVLSRVPRDDWADIPPRAMVKRFQAFGFELGKENDMLRRRYTQAYHACITFIDAQIGLLLKGLKTSGLWDNTIVVLTSDHGYHLGEHFMWGKVTLFEECARVPLIVRVPDRTRQNSQSAGLVELVDLYPTLAELCGLRPPDGLQGRSFVKRLAGPALAGKEVAYTVVSRGATLGRSIRTVRWRYAEWGSPDQAELYDLQRDPREHANLATDGGYAAVVKQLRERLRNRASAVARAAQR